MHGAGGKQFANGCDRFGHFQNREIVYPQREVGRDIRHIFYGVYRIYLPLSRIAS